MLVNSALAPRAYKPAAARTSSTGAPAMPTKAPLVPAKAPVVPATKVASSSHAIAKWSLIGGSALGAFGIPMLALAGGAGFGLWMLPAALGGAAFGAIAYGGIGFLIDRLVNHFRH